VKTFRTLSRAFEVQSADAGNVGDYGQPLKAPPVPGAAGIVGDRTAIIIPGIVLLNPTQATGLGGRDSLCGSLRRHIGREHR
jgi:hypothetical protein